MSPIAKSTRSFGDIAEYWSREIYPRASWDEILRELESAWWLGELRGSSGPTRLQRLRNMFTSMRHRDDLGIVFIVGDCAGPQSVELPDGSLIVDLRHQIRVPSGNTESWDEAACRDAFHALAKTCSKESYPELTVGFTLTELSYEEFSTWCTKGGFFIPTFWKPGDQTHRHHAGAASSAGSDNEAAHLGSGAPQKETKAWRAKPSERLTASEIAVVKAMNEIWPDGRLDHKAKARNERIRSHLKIAKQEPVSPRTIQRALKKIHLR